MTIILLQLQRHRGLVETLQPLDTKVVSSILALGDTQFGFFIFIFFSIGYRFFLFFFKTIIYIKMTISI